MMSSLDELVRIGKEDMDLTGEEIFKFQNMGPITGEELGQTDWDSVIRKLTS